MAGYERAVPRRWIEYWVADRDEYGDVVHYIWQESNKRDPGGRQAWEYFADPGWTEGAAYREIEKVTCRARFDSVGNVYDRDEDYEVLATRHREEVNR